MKIQAKNIQVGQTVKWGVVTLTVERIVPFTQKNGIEGKIFYGPATRSFGRGVKPIKYETYDINAKNETFLTLI